MAADGIPPLSAGPSRSRPTLGDQMSTHTVEGAKFSA